MKAKKKRKPTPRQRLFTMDRWGRPVPAKDVLQWAAWFEIKDRTIDYTMIKEATRRREAIYVSTVFLGINHNFADDGPPVLFETMIFGGPYNEQGERYITRGKALKGHRKWVAIAQGERVRA